MKILVSLLVTCSVALGFTACATDGGADCQGDHCVCTTADSCDHDCANGAASCHIQGSTGPVDVTCSNNAECHVECGSAAGCNVDCGGSAECHVTCPATGCTVTDCVGADCVVSCGLGGVASRSGTTATCP